MTPNGPGGDPNNPSRKQRREQAREQRKAAEQAEAAAAARRKRLMQLGSIVAAVVVIIVVIVVATGGKGSPAEAPAPQTASVKTDSAKTVAQLLKGIPQSGNTLGKQNAPLTMQYFGDLECPICRDFTLGALPGVIENEVRTGKLKIEYLSFQTATREPEVFREQQVAAYAAGKQDKAWYYIELFYHEQGDETTNYVNESYLQGIASQVPGLDRKQWSEDRNDKALEDQVYKDEKRANEIGFKGTPSFTLGKTGGQLKPAFIEVPFTDSAPFEAEINKLAAS